MLIKQSVKITLRFKLGSPQNLQMSHTVNLMICQHTRPESNYQPFKVCDIYKTKLEISEICFKLANAAVTCYLFGNFVPFTVINFNY